MVSIQSREIPTTRTRAALSYALVRQRLIWIALIGTSLMSYTATAAFVVAALRPASSQHWLIALGVATVGEALLIVLKLMLRDDSRSMSGWAAALLDMATNTAGVYWWAPGVALVPGIADALAAVQIDPAGGLARVLVSALIGAFLSAAPVWLLPLALADRER